MITHPDRPFARDCCLWTGPLRTNPYFSVVTPASIGLRSVRSIKTLWTLGQTLHTVLFGICSFFDPNRLINFNNFLSYIWNVMIWNLFGIQADKLFQTHNPYKISWHGTWSMLFNLYILNVLYIWCIFLQTPEELNTLCCREQTKYNWYDKLCKPI